MRKHLVLLAAVAMPLCAQDWARQELNKSPRHHEWATVKHDGRSVETFVVYPESKEKTPVVLMIHEIFGESDWIQELADEVAAAGYIAVAPDLLSGMGPNGGGTSSFPDPTKGVSKLTPDQVTADLNAAQITPSKCHQPTASCLLRDSAGVADRAFDLRQTGRTCPPRWCSTDRPPQLTP